MKHGFSVLFCLGVVVGCGGDEEPPPAPPETASELIHLVTDAGTTGTRFCLFITRSDVENGKKVCSEPREFRVFRDGERQTHCLSKSSADAGSTLLPKTATGGLQDLLVDPPKARALVESAMVQVDQVLSSRQKKLSAAAILGTAGFRDATTGAVDDGKYEPLWQEVRQVFSSRQIPVVTRTLRPEEEARFAWITVRFLHLRNEAFSIIETGGGGCHFASGDTNAEYVDIKSASDSFGTSKAWQTYAAEDVRQVEIPALKEPAFKVCYSGNSADATGQDATACVAFLKAKLFDSSLIAAKVKEVAAPARKLYGMGLAWNGMFTTYFPGKVTVSVNDVHDAAGKECALPQKDAKGFIKHQSCFALAFQEAFLRTAAGDNAQVTNGIESWPRGASVSPGGEFEGCKDSTIKVVVEEE